MEQLQKITVVFALVSYVAFGFSQLKLQPTVMVGGENLATKSEEAVLYCPGSRLDGDLLHARARAEKEPHSDWPPGVLLRSIASDFQQ